MSLNEFLPPVLLAAAITFFLRALPSAIMAVLIVYCLKFRG